MNNKTFSLGFLVLMMLYISSMPFISSLAADTGSVKVYPVEDTFVNTFMGTRVYGDWDTLWVARELKELDPRPGWNNKHILLMFDLSAIPSGKKIVSVNLMLYCVSFEGENVNFVSYHCSSSDWDEDTLNHGLYQFNVIGGVYDEGSAEVAVNAASKWYSVDVSEDIEDFVGGTLTEVLMIVSNHMNRYVEFSSKEGDHAPYLEFTFEKTQASITCQASETEVQLGDAITINGKLTPSMATTLSVKYQSGAATQQKSVTTAADGTYTDSYTPTEAGTWSVTVEWQGTTEYTDADASIQVTVSSPEQPAQPAIPGFPIEAILLSVLISGIVLATTRKKPLL